MTERDRILRDSLGAAVADVTTKLGADANTWRCGRLHVAKFDHALMPFADKAKATATQLSVGPLAVGGAAHVPRAAAIATRVVRPEISISQRTHATMCAVAGSRGWSSSADGSSQA